MFKKIKEIKDFIVWCKNNKVKSVKYGDLEFELSEISFVDEISSIKADEMSQEIKEKNILNNESTNKEDDEMLYWSSN